MERTRILFLGTPSFALSSLEALLAEPDFDVVGVVTQPDRPVGRDQALTAPPVKRLAQANNLLVFQPERLRHMTEQIREINPDLMVVVAYGQLIPPEILEIPKFGCINVHGSLLPKYRGAAVIQAPILNGDTESGVTIMLMDEGLDTGPILNQQKIQLAPNETAASLFVKLSELGASLLVSTLRKYLIGVLRPVAQDNSQASKVGLLKKDDGRINWQNAASQIERLVRAMFPWPVAWTTWNDKNLKILEVENTTLQINQYKPGQVFIHNGKLAIQCGINSLIIRRLQLEGRQESTDQDFMRGYSGIIHSVLT